MKNTYKCSKCGKLIKRDSNKKWILSWCDAKAMYVRIILQTKPASIMKNLLIPTLIFFASCQPSKPAPLQYTPRMFRDKPHGVTIWHRKSDDPDDISLLIQDAVNHATDDTLMVQFVLFTD